MNANEILIVLYGAAKEAGLRGYGIAEQLGMSPIDYSHRKTGRVSWRLDEIMKFADLLGYRLRLERKPEKGRRNEKEKA